MPRSQRARQPTLIRETAPNTEEESYETARSEELTDLIPEIYEARSRMQRLSSQPTFQRYNDAQQRTEAGPNCIRNPQLKVTLPCTLP